MHERTIRDPETLTVIVMLNTFGDRQRAELIEERLKLGSRSRKPDVGACAPEPRRLG